MSDSGSQDEYEVQAILGQKQRADGMYYLVKWRSYPMADSTWELQQNLAYCIPMIKRFEQQYHQENPHAKPGQTGDSQPSAMRLLNAAKDFYGLATSAEREFRPSSPAILYGSSDDPASSAAQSPPSSVQRLCRDQMNRAGQAMRQRFQSQRVIAILDRALDRFGRVRIQVEWSTGAVTWEPLATATYFYPLFEAYEHRRFSESKPGPVRRPPALAHKRTHARPPPPKPDSVLIAATPVVPPTALSSTNEAPTSTITTPSAPCTLTMRSSPPLQPKTTNMPTKTVTPPASNQKIVDDGKTASSGLSPTSSPLPSHPLRQQLVQNVPGAAALQFLTPVVVVPSDKAEDEVEASSLIYDPSIELPGWQSSLDLKAFYNGIHCLGLGTTTSRKRRRLEQKRSNSLTSSLSSDSEDLFDSFFDLSSDPLSSPIPSENESSALNNTVPVQPRASGYLSSCKPWTHYSAEEQDQVIRQYAHRIHCTLCTGPRERQQERELAHSLSYHKPSTKTRVAMQRPAHFLICQTCQAPFHPACVARLAAAVRADITTDAELPPGNPWSLVNAQLQHAINDARPLFD
ncbi:hypothetical protein H4R35_006903, partial [Dimargaris xerosporica]